MTPIQLILLALVWFARTIPGLTSNAGCSPGSVLGVYLEPSMVKWIDAAGS